MRRDRKRIVSRRRLGEQRGSHYLEGSFALEPYLEGKRALMEQHREAIG